MARSGAARCAAPLRSHGMIDAFESEIQKRKTLFLDQRSKNEEQDRGPRPRKRRHFVTAGQKQTVCFLFHHEGHEGHKGHEGKRGRKERPEKVRHDRRDLGSATHRFGNRPTPRCARHNHASYRGHRPPLPSLTFVSFVVKKTPVRPHAPPAATTPPTTAPGRFFLPSLLLFFFAFAALRKSTAFRFCGFAKSVPSCARPRSGRSAVC